MRSRAGALLTIIASLPALSGCNRDFDESVSDGMEPVEGPVVAGAGSGDSAASGEGAPEPSTMPPAKSEPDDGGMCEARAADAGLVEDFSRPCTLDSFEIQNSEALAQPLLLDGLRLELKPDTPEPLKTWWESDNGPFVYTLVQSEGFVALAEVLVTSNRIDGGASQGQFQVGGLMVATPPEITGDWVFNGIGYLDGDNADCPLESSNDRVSFGSYAVITEWSNSTRCVRSIPASRAQLAICRHLQRVVAYQRPLPEEGASEEWALLHTGSIEQLEGALRVGLAISTPRQVPEISARFSKLRIETDGVTSFDACSQDNFQARFGELE